MLRPVDIQTENKQDGGEGRGGVYRGIRREQRREEWERQEEGREGEERERRTG